MSVLMAESADATERFVATVFGRTSIKTDSLATHLLISELSTRLQIPHVRPYRILVSAVGFAQSCVYYINHIHNPVAVGIIFIQVQSLLHSLLHS